MVRETRKKMESTNKTLHISDAIFLISKYENECIKLLVQRAIIFLLKMKKKFSRLPEFEINGLLGFVLRRAHSFYFENE